MPIPAVKKLLFDSAALRDFSTRVLLQAGASAEDAAIAADVLLAADMRGVSSMASSASSLTITVA